MDLDAVMEEIAVAIREVGSLAGRTYGFPPDTVTPPAAIVGYPEVNFDQTYARGMDRWDVPVWVVVGRVSDRSARAALSPYVSGGGASSIKAAIDDGTYTECDVATVTGAQVTYVNIAGTDYLAAEFSVDVVGSGE